MTFLLIFRAKPKSFRSSSGWIVQFILTGCSFVCKYACSFLNIKIFFLIIFLMEKLSEQKPNAEARPQASKLFLLSERGSWHLITQFYWKPWHAGISSPWALQVWNFEQVWNTEQSARGLIPDFKKKKREKWGYIKPHAQTRTSDFHPGYSPDLFRNCRVSQEISSKDYVLCFASGAPIYILMVLRSFHDQT